jgi:hypothetical protein
MSSSEAEEINELINRYVDEHKSPVDKQDEEQEEEKKKEEEKNLPGNIGRMLVSAFSGVTKIFARKLDIPEVAFTPDDEKELEDALAPFEDQLMELIKYIVYLPLIIFAIGYTARVIDGVQKKKEKAVREKEQKEKERKEELKKQEEKKDGKPGQDREEVEKNDTADKHG